MIQSEKTKTMWFKITEQLDVQTCLDLNTYIQREERKAQKELVEQYFTYHKDNRHNFMVAKRNTLK